jgi:hypothetical protein
MCHQDLQACVPLDEIYAQLRKINSHLLEAIAHNVLSGFHALLHTIMPCEPGKKLDWREEEGEN